MYNITLTPIIILITMITFILSTDAAKIEDVVPANSLAYLTLYDLDEMWDTGAESESWQAIFKNKKETDSLPDMDAMMGIMQMTIGTDLRGILDIFEHQIALAVMPPRIGHNEPKMAVIANTSGLIQEAENVITSLSAFLAMNAESGGNPDAGEYEKVQYGTIALNEKILKYGFIDELLVIGVSEGGFETIVDTYRKVYAPIAKNAKFKNIRKKFKNIQLFGYVDVEKALPVLRADNNEEDLDKFEASGTESIDAIGYGMDVFSIDGLQKLYIQMKKDAPKGFFGTLFREGKSIKSLMPLMGSEDAFLAMSFGNLSDVIEAFQKLAKSKESGDNDLQEGIQKLEEASGLDFEKDILESLTGEIAISSNISNEAKLNSPSIPWEEPALFMTLKSRDNWRATLDALQDLAEASVQREYHYKDATIRQLTRPSDEEFKTIGYGLTNDFFVASTSTERVQNVIDIVATAEPSSEMNNLFKRLPAPPSLLVHLNLEKLLPHIFNRDKSEPQAPDVLSARLQNIGSFEYIISTTPDGLWMCFGTTSGKNFIETSGTIASFFVQ